MYKSSIINNLEKDANNNEQTKVKKEEKIENNNIKRKGKDEYFNNYYKKLRKRKGSQKDLVQINDNENLQETKNKLVLDANQKSSVKISINVINTIYSKLFSMKTKNIEETDRQNHDFKL